MNQSKVVLALRLMKMLQNNETLTIDEIAAACGYDLKNHHHALADAEACAMIAMKTIPISDLIR